MTIKDLCLKHSISQSALARRYGIPLRTVQNWCGGINTPPEYLVKMIDILLSNGL